MSVRKSQTVKLQGKDYFMVAGRIIEFREKHPEFSIITDYRSIADVPHMFAAVLNDQGRTLATSHKRVRLDAKGPAGQYPVESAETGAIGRALGLLGFGTLGGDFEEDMEQIADAPVKNPWK